MYVLSELLVISAFLLYAIRVLPLLLSFIAFFYLMLTVKYLSLSIFPLKVYVISGRSSLRLVILFPFRSVVICGFRISFRISRAMSFYISIHRSRVVYYVILDLNCFQ